LYKFIAAVVDVLVPDPAVQVRFDIAPNTVDACGKIKAREVVVVRAGQVPDPDRRGTPK